MCAEGEPWSDARSPGRCAHTALTALQTCMLALISDLIATVLACISQGLKGGEITIPDLSHGYFSDSYKIIK